MDVKLIPLDQIHPYEKNPRKNDDAVDKVAASIREFGFNVPIIVDGDWTIVAGHTRYRAAGKLGLKEIPVIVVEGLTDEQIRQYRIIDNKTGELSSWDYDKLMMELGAIPEIDMSAFEFGGFGGADDTEEGTADLTTNLDEGYELDLSEYEDEAFDNECPYCGFRWNE